MQKCIVFDLDETIGYFPQIYLICNKFQTIYNIQLDESIVHKIFDNFFHIFTPGIFVLFSYIRVLKEKNDNLQVTLYTNTKLPTTWIRYIISYIDMKIHTFKFFDHIIHLNTIHRTTIKKNFSDLCNCCNFSKDNINILFIDNITHPLLLNKNTYYREIPNYFYIYDNSYIWSFLHKLYNISQKIPRINNNQFSCNKNNKNIVKSKRYIIKIFPKLKLFLLI